MWTYVLSDLNGEELLECFTKKNRKNQINRFPNKKVIKIKGDKLYVIWKEYDNSLNSWTDKKNTVI